MISIELGHYLALGGVIFLLGIVGIFLNRKNVIVILMSIELILLAVNINLVAFSTYSNEITGQIFTLFILTYRKREGVKKQSYINQISRESKTSVDVVEADFNAGVKIDD